MDNPYQLGRRKGGGVHIKQGRSFILLSSEEANQLVRDIRDIMDCPRAEKTTQIDQT